MSVLRGSDITHLILSGAALGYNYTLRLRLRE